MNLQDLRETGKIRDRGQLTIPYNIREVLTWLKTNSVIEFVPKKTGKLEIQPFVPFKKAGFKKVKSQKEINTLWQKMRTIGSSGRQIKLAEFVIKDRESH